MSQHQIHLSSTPTPPASLLTLLHSHLPHSLSVLRRLQFANNFSGGSTPHTHVLLARYNDEDESGRDGDGDGDGDGDEEANDGIAFKGEKLQHFTAAYVDLSRAPETQCWVYSSLEDGRAVVGGGDGEEKETEEEAKAMELVMAVMRRIRGIALADNKKEGKAEEGKILVGSLHEAVRQRMLRRGVRMEPSANVPPELGWEFCGKWLFRLEDLPPVERVDKDGDEAGTGLPEWMRWDRVREEDLGLVLSRTSIARQKKTLLMLPSMLVRLSDGSPVAWAFMGLDGTIITLHVEEPYRRLGLAKAVASKLMREHLSEYGDDGWGAADVFVLNDKSQAFCKSIGGKLSWTHSWAVVHLTSVGEPM